ncbi:MspA family porin [Nocardia takedensis]|uniref:MspA family porin n=1 Tax=Nocardia takedensis TaxID=259390 RepID=UPI0002F2394C|nr:MspA family porin [Nocardia takedensis]
MPSNLSRAAAIALGAILACAPLFASPPRATAEIVPMPPHEKTFVSPNGISFMVGNRDETINRIPPLNMMGTTREALVSGVAYGRLDGGTAGKLRVGYHVGCAVEIGGSTIGVTPNFYYYDPDLDPGNNDPLAIAPVATLNLNPGQVTDVAMMEKTMVPGKQINLGVRDYHIRVNSCTGPVTLRQYTYVYLESEDTDDSGAVFGDSTWL